ncbi:YolD-like family protein [Priestia megaterium]|uniref:YolD-like family protein n=1 Tax=Priestia megaterium TaxID=1404 RepID=UPI003009DA31
MNEDRFSQYLEHIAEQARHSCRGMRKWKPFASMPEQYAGLNHVMEDLHKVERPLLTADQQEQINYTINQAIHSKKSVQITYYKDGHIVTGLGVITHVNDHQQLLYYIDDVFELNCNLPLNSIVDVRFN